jgi:prepilin-type N-terminal cleavage/methylation domain-containing protein
VSESRPRNAAFTLLEVLAAVAVVGLVYWVLFAMAIDAVGAEGDAQRRLRASLLADRALGEVEGLLAGGISPQIGRTESDEDPYRIEVEIAPYGLAQVAARIVEQRKAEKRGGSRVPEPALLVAPSQGPAPLLSIAVRVSWQEGSREAEVRRTSFGFDPVAAAPILAAAASAREGRSGGEDGETPAGADAQRRRKDDAGDRGARGAGGGGGRSGRRQRPPGEPFQPLGTGTGGDS